MSPITPTWLRCGGLALTLLALPHLPGGRWLSAPLLVVVVVLAGLPLGAIVMLLCQRLCCAAWGELAETCWQTLLASLPYFSVALLCLLPVMSTLNPALNGESHWPLSEFKSLYLEPIFFYLRTVLYLLVWLALAAVLRSSRRWSMAFYALGLLLWLLTVSFFAVDWFLSLTPKFYSDIFGLLLASYFLAPCLFLALLIPGATDQTAVDIARLNCAVLISWAFLSFFQWVLIWSANIPAEISWYLLRRESAWSILFWLSVLCFFLVPLLMLSAGHWKTHWRTRQIIVIAGLSGYCLQGIWLLLPSLDSFDWRSLLLVVGAIVLTAFVWERRVLWPWRQHG